MADGRPKDYSSMDQDESPPLPPVRVAAGTNQKRVHGWSDGSMSVPRHRESGIDLAVLCEKLRELPTEKIAKDSMRNHYSDVFGNRKQELPPTRIKVVINYVDDKEVYIINVPQRTAKMIKNLAPKRGNYRYFFEHIDGAYEEMVGDIMVPIHHRDNGNKSIRCKVFYA